MLTLIEGGFTSALHNEVVEEVKRAIRRGSRVYMIVPEQQTVSSEFMMSEILPNDAPLYFEVTNFTRFTNTAFRTIGGISGEYCSPVAKSLIMWRTLTELSPILSMTRGRANIAPGIVAKALSAVAELQSLGISAEMLEELVGGLEGRGRLYEKLSDITKVYSLYAKLVGERYTDAANDATTLANMLSRDAGFLSGCEIIIDGFTSFTEPQYKLIGEIMKYVPLTVALTLDRTVDGAFEYSEVVGARQRLIRLADLGSVPKRQKKASRHDTGRPSIIGEVCDLLWRTDDRLDKNSLHLLDEDGGRVRIFNSPTMYEECEFVAADIRRRVMSGAKYLDIAIIARDTKPYQGVLDIALDMANVPYFLSRTTDISTTPLVKLISTAYSAITDGFRRESVITYLKCGLSDIDVNERDELELYIDKWNIDKKRLQDTSPWRMNPRGYEKMTDDDRERLARINSTRDRVMAPLFALKAMVDTAKTVREHADALLSFLTEISVTKKLTERATRLLMMGDKTGADEGARLWGVLCDALDVVVDILGEFPADAESFLGQVMVALSGAKVGHIPAYIDAVTIGSAEMIRLDGKKHIYLLGCNAGEFPAAVRESAFFTERDKAKLSELGVPIEPDLAIKNARELYSFSRAFASGRDSVTLTYSDKTPMLAALNPSEVIGNIARITHDKIKPIKTTTIPKVDMIYTPECALDLYPRLGEEEQDEVRNALCKVGFSEKVTLLSGDIKNAELTLGEGALAILYHGDLYLSQSKINEFLSCPMSYFCKYNLHLGEESQAEIDALVIGNFVHGVIEGFFCEAERQGRAVGDFTDEEREAITRRATEEYVEALMGESGISPRTRVTISRLARATRPVIDGLCDEFRGAKYEPKFFELELKYGDDKSPTPLTIKGDDGRIIIGGKIDRTDIFKHGKDVYVRVIDYKTGNTPFLPSRINNGEFLQMFIYLRALTETKSRGFLDTLGVEPGGSVIPGGVIYVKTAVKTPSVRKEEELPDKLAEMYLRDGMVLKDEVNIEAMNPDFMPPVPGANTTKFEDRHYSPEVWQEISNTIEDVVKDVATRMRSGDIKTTPAARDGKSCNRCSYRAVCRNAKVSEKPW